MFMLDVFTKDGNTKQLVEGSDIQQRFEGMSIVQSSNQNRAHIYLDMSANGNDGTPDYATLLIFGSNGTSNFAALVFVNRWSTDPEVTVLSGNKPTISGARGVSAHRVIVTIGNGGTLAVVSTCKISISLGA